MYIYLFVYILACRFKHWIFIRKYSYILYEWRYYFPCSCVCVCVAVGLPTLLHIFPQYATHVWMVGRKHM